jgi:hypothetical protein
LSIRQTRLRVLFFYPIQHPTYPAVHTMRTIPSPPSSIPPPPPGHVRNCVAAARRAGACFGCVVCMATRNEQPRSHERCRPMSIEISCIYPPPFPSSHRKGGRTFLMGDRRFFVLLVSSRSIEEENPTPIWRFTIISVHLRRRRRPALLFFSRSLVGAP